jgi:hypothetical protein
MILAINACNHKSFTQKNDQQKIDSLVQVISQERERMLLTLDSIKIVRERDSIMNLIEKESFKNQKDSNEDSINDSQLLKSKILNTRNSSIK